MRGVITSLAVLSMTAALLRGDDAVPGPVPLGGTVREWLVAANPAVPTDDVRGWPMRMHSLLQGEYSFFRGTADLFYALCRERFPDLASGDTATVLLHGDVHLGNIGTYRSADPTGVGVRFGLVDLDEVAVGPYRLDLLRAATSLRFAAADGNVAASEADIRGAVEALCGAYAEALRAPSGDNTNAASVPIVRHLLDEAAGGDLQRYAGKFALFEGEIRFRPARLKDGTVTDILESAEPAEWRQVREALTQYLFDGPSEESRALLRIRTEAELHRSIADIVRWTRVGSSGSQGLRKYLVLLTGALRDGDAPLILQLKEESAPALVRAEFATGGNGSARAVEVAWAHRVLMSPEPWLVGYTRIQDRGYLVKTKDPFGEELSSRDLKRAEDLVALARVMGMVVGNAHRRAVQPPTAPERIATEASTLTDQLCERSRLLHDWLRVAYRELAADAEAQRMAAEAEQFIQSFRPGAP